MTDFIVKYPSGLYGKQPAVQGLTVHAPGTIQSAAYKMTPFLGSDLKVHQRPAKIELQSLFQARMNKIYNQLMDYAGGTDTKLNSIKTDAYEVPDKIKNERQGLAQGMRRSEFLSRSRTIQSGDKYRRSGTFL